MNKKKSKISKKTIKETAKKVACRKHDPFFRYIYAIPENTRTLLRLAERKNLELRRMLSSVDMQSLELIPGSFSNVKEWGQSDLAFKAKFKNGSDFFVGILLEHKSYRKSDVLSQIYEYTFEVMVKRTRLTFDGSRRRRLSFTTARAAGIRWLNFAKSIRIGSTVRIFLSNASS